MPPSGAPSGWLSPASDVLTRRSGSGGLRRERNVYLDTALLRDDGDRVERGERGERRGLEREEPHFRASPRVVRDTHGSARRMNDARVGRALGDGRSTYRPGSGRRSTTGSSASSAARRTHKTHGASGLGSERWHSGSVWRSVFLPENAPLGCAAAGLGALPLVGLCFAVVVVCWSWSSTSPALAPAIALR